jgi:2'-5' RNA ligase
MPAPGSVGPEDKWHITIQVTGELGREQIAEFDKAIRAAIQAAEQAAQASQDALGPIVPPRRRIAAAVIKNGKFPETR